MLLLDPVETNGGEPLKVRVEWFIDGKWYLAAENQVVFRK